MNWDAHSFAKQQHSNTRAPKIRFGLTGCSQPFSSNILGFEFLRLSRMLRLVSTVLKSCKLCGQRGTATRSSCAFWGLRHLAGQKAYSGHRRRSGYPSGMVSVAGALNRRHLAQLRVQVGKLAAPPAPSRACQESATTSDTTRCAPTAESIGRRLGRLLSHETRVARRGTFDLTGDRRGPLEVP